MTRASSSQSRLRKAVHSPRPLSSAEKTQQWETWLTEPDLDAEESVLLCQLASHHDLIPRDNDDWASLLVSLKSSKATIDGGRITAPIGRPAIAPRFISNKIENAQIEDSPESRKTIHAVVAAAYRAACVEANEALGEIDAEARGGELPKSLLALLGEAPALYRRRVTRPESRKKRAWLPPRRPNQKRMRSPVRILPLRPIRHGCQTSECPRFAGSQSRRICAPATGDWNVSVQHNANVNAGIFIAENGDLRMSEIERRHVLVVDARLKTMPTIWGKCREDRQGGLKAVFMRGEVLANEWNKDPLAAEQKGLPKVVLSPATYNRHINTLKQLFTFVQNLEDANGKPTHVAPKANRSRYSRSFAPS